MQQRRVRGVISGNIISVRFDRPRREARHVTRCGRRFEAGGEREKERGREDFSKARTFGWATERPATFTGIAPFFQTFPACARSASDEFQSPSCTRACDLRDAVRACVRACLHTCARVPQNFHKTAGNSAREARGEDARRAGERTSARVRSVQKEGGGRESYRGGYEGQRSNGNMESAR